MNNNHLIIGLGGTGGKIIRALRKTIYEEYRSKEPLLRIRNGQGLIEEKPHPVKLAYLYVDSDASLMDREHSSWRIPGDTLQLGQANQLVIRGANLLNVLENLSAYPNISPWIGPRDKWRDILGSVVGEALGGQKRRLGRFLFACRASGADGFVAKLRNQVAELKKASGENSVTFHVCCGLAGGTGSGSFLDVVALIRKHYPEDHHRVVLYALLPDIDPPANWDTGNYHANGFSALAELNALGVGSYFPHDVEDGRERISFRDPSGTPVSPVNGCYIMSNENEKGKVLSLDRDEVSQVAASFLFQKIVMAGATPWGDELRRAENAENGDGSPETAPGTNIPERSKRFLAFGIKRVVIPEEEIREYLTYQFARQTVLQLQFNNWSATQQGFLDVPVNEAFAQYVSDARNHERWMVSDAHLCLEAGILPMEQQEHWQPIEVEWNTTITKYLQIAMKGEAASWMGRLTQMCEELYSLRWRGKGIKDFYRTKEADQQAQAAAIISSIEGELFEDWIQGRRSMYDLGRILAEFKKWLREKKDLCDRKVAQFRSQVEEGQGQNALLADIRKNNQTWAGIGVLSGVMGKREKVLQAQGEVFKRLYSGRHRVEAWSYAGKLVDRVLLELEALASTVATNVSLLTELVDGEARQTVQNRFEGLRERIEARCPDDDAIDFSEQVIKFYKPQQVKEMTTRLIGSEEIQAASAGAVRRVLLEKIGENPTLARFNQRLNKGVLLDLLETVCGEEAEKAHNQTITDDPRAQRILGNNIVDKLYRDFNGNPMGLAHYIGELVSHAGLYLTFDSMEEQNTNPGAGPRTRVVDFAVILPKGQEFPEFSQQIEEAFKRSYGTKVSFVEGTKANEITMISVARLFPLRYSKHVRMLEEKYRKRLGSFERAKLEAHSEGEGKGHPPVFLVSGDKVEMLPLLLLGRALRVIQELEDPDTGAKGVYLLSKDERGRENTPAHLGESEEDIVEKRDVAMSYQLQSVIQKTIATDFQHREKREKIRDALNEVYKDIESKIPNPLDKRRKTCRDAIAKAEEMLN
ncbi:MAG: tubulin-like doman-containing protein [Terrimicrobiaceae bacterium]